MMTTSLICANLGQSVLNVLCIVGLVVVGVLIVVFLCDALLALFGNKNGIFFKSRKTDEKDNQAQAVQSYTYQPERKLDKTEELDKPYTNVDFEKARQEEKALNDKLSLGDDNNQDDADNEFADLDALLFGDDDEEQEAQEVVAQNEEIVEEETVEQVQEENIIEDSEEVSQEQDVQRRRGRRRRRIYPPLAGSYGADLHRRREGYQGRAHRRGPPGRDLLRHRSAPDRSDRRGVLHGGDRGIYPETHKTIFIYQH